MKVKVSKLGEFARIVVIPKERASEFEIGEEVFITRKEPITKVENPPGEGRDKTYGMGGEILKLTETVVKKEMDKHVVEYH